MSEAAQPVSYNLEQILEQISSNYSRLRQQLTDAHTNLTSVLRSQEMVMLFQTEELHYHRVFEHLILTAGFDEELWTTFQTDIKELRARHAKELAAVQKVLIERQNGSSSSESEALVEDVK